MLTRIKQFFEIEKPYTFDYNDLRCGITLVNVILIMIFGLSIAWFGLIVSILGTVRDLFCVPHRVNSTIMHATNILLNAYFVSLM